MFSASVFPALLSHLVTKAALPCQSCFVTVTRHAFIGVLLVTSSFSRADGALEGSAAAFLEVCPGPIQVAAPSVEEQCSQPFSPLLGEKGAGLPWSCSVLLSPWFLDGAYGVWRQLPA